MKRNTNPKLIMDDSISCNKIQNSIITSVNKANEIKMEVIVVRFPLGICNNLNDRFGFILFFLYYFFNRFG